MSGAPGGMQGEGTLPDTQEPLAATAIQREVVRNLAIIVV